MKKLVTFLLAVCTAIASFTACDIPTESSNDSQSSSSSCEHTYEWVGSEGGHQKVYTCGCPSPDIVELHNDNNGDYQCDVCGWAIDGILPELLPEWADSLIQAYEKKYPQAGKAKILHYYGTYESGAIVAMLAGSDEGFDDAMWTEMVAYYDFNYSNGNRIRVLYGDEFYALTQAYENGYLTKENIADIHKKRELDYIDDVVTEYIFTHIGGIEMSNIQKIETVKCAGSISPIDRAPVEYKTSTLATDIENVYNWLSALKENVTKISDDEDAVLMAGNSVTDIYVYTTNNNCFKVSDIGRNYLYFYGAYYAQEGKTPEIVGETVTYKFESYYDEAQLYIGDEKVKEYTFDFDKLVCIKKDFVANGTPYKLVTSIGSLYLYDETHFIRNGVQYEIISEFDFSQIFAEFPINGEKGLLYKVTIVDKYNEFFDKPTGEYFEEGTVITMHCYPIMDADLVMYINGERVGIQNAVEGADGYYIWEYSFVVPAEDITITFQMSGGM